MVQKSSQIRIPPQNIEAEKAILGSIMLRPGAIHEVTDIIIPDSFYEMGYQNNSLMIMPPMALILVGIIIWVHRARNKELCEK